MSNLVFLTLLPPILIGFLLSSWLLLPTRKGNLLLLLSLGIPLGFGVSSCLLFFWSFIFNPGFPGFGIVELLLITLLVYLNWKQRQFIDLSLPDVKKWTRFDWIFALLFLAIGIISLGVFYSYTQINPNGLYDAWAIWTVRARMLTRAGLHWKTVFIPQVFHADYPLMLPLSIAHSWILAGTESQRIPSAIAGLFTFASAGILVGSLFSLARKQLSWLAGIIFLSTPWVIFIGAKQCADLPLAACITAASSCLGLALVDRDHASRWLILAGLSAGLAGWMKNEGQLFLVIFLAVTCISVLLTFKHAHPFRMLGRILIGLLLPLAVIIIFKITLAPPNDVVDTGNLGSAVNQLLSFPRYGEVLTEMINFPGKMGGWILPIPLVGLVFWLLLKPHIDHENQSPALTLSALVILQWVGYFLIFVITPHDIRVHVIQSYDRLLMHIYPSFLLCLFLFLTPLEDLIDPINLSK